MSRHPAENRPAVRDSRIALGRTRAGTVPKVVFVSDDDGDGLSVVTAFDLTGNAPAAFRRGVGERGRR